eukprot:gene4085-5833_t
MVSKSSSITIAYNCVRPRNIQSSRLHHNKETKLKTKKIDDVQLKSNQQSQLLIESDALVNGVGLIVMSITSFEMAIDGSLNNILLNTSGIFASITAIIHALISLATPRDFTVPRLADSKTIYEISALFLVGFSWLLFRLTPFPFFSFSHSLDIIMTISISLFLIYQFVFYIIGKMKILDANSKSKIIQQSMVNAELLLNGNGVLASLTCLFVPFIWTYSIRGIDWWTRVQSIYPNQAAYMCISVLVAIIGNNFGMVLFARKQFSDILSTKNSDKLPEELLVSNKSDDQFLQLVTFGVLSNLFLLLAPEIAFHWLHSAGISEIEFYWQ